MPKLLLALVALLCVVELPTAKGQGKSSLNKQQFVEVGHSHYIS